ncbi:NAD(P)/FAD-dependent oxidoreductase [Haliea sp. E17]|uniref:NAD(P)/FAD-dependent oxidoreductase n=1 Tax=Haliea sp. E17 TaxID=3401576 RepID=UPI003AADBE5D
MHERLLIVGAGMASAYLLQELGKTRHPYAVTVIGDEAEACYNRVLLSNVLAGENTEEDLDMLGGVRGDEGNPPWLRFLTGTRIMSVDTADKCVVDSAGQRHSYDRLVLATGASVARPQVDCRGIQGVHAFRTVADTRKLRHLAAGSGGRAVVVGGGLLGLEAAHGLNALGFSTCVVHRNTTLMNRQLDSEGGRQLQRDLVSRGIDFRLGRQVASLVTTADQEIAGITLDDGEELPCELLLFATGITPNASLAREAGIPTQRGILVDERLQSAAPGVYALGECSQFGDATFGLVAPIRLQASVLAAELSGKPHPPFRIEDYPTQLKISGVEIFRAGELDDAAEQLLLRSGDIYRRLIIRDDRLVGAVLVGDKRGGTWYAELIASGQDISNLRSALAFGREVGESHAAAAAA